MTYKNKYIHTMDHFDTEQSNTELIPHLRQLSHFFRQPTAPIIPGSQRKRGWKQAQYWYVSLYDEPILRRIWSRRPWSAVIINWFYLWKYCLQKDTRDKRVLMYTMIYSTLCESLKMSFIQSCVKQYITCISLTYILRISVSNAFNYWVNFSKT